MYEITPIPAPAPRDDFPLSVQWQADGVDLGAPNVRIINFVAALDEFLVSRGTGEQSNVITVRRLLEPPPPPSCTRWLVDNFNGPQEDLELHTPDVAPAGFVWRGPEDMFLDGDGRVVIGSDATPAPYIASASADSWAQMTTGTTFSILFTGTLPQADPPPACLFVDTFSDSEGTLLSDHIPDIAPSGFAWIAPSMSFVPMEINASNQAVAVPNDPGPVTGRALQAEDTFTLEPTFPYTISVTGRADEDTAPSGFNVSFYSTVDTTYFTVTQYSHGGGLYSSEVEMTNYGAGGGYAYANTASTSYAGERTVSILVEETQMTVTFDGVTGSPIDAGGLMPSFYDLVDVTVDRAQSTNTANVSRISLCNGVPPPPPPPPTADFSDPANSQYLVLRSIGGM